MAKILIVEDATDVAKALALRVTSRGHTPILAADAAAGTALAKAERPDLVLLDIAMPPDQEWGIARAGGIAVAHRLRADADTQTIPIIFLTAGGDDTIRQTALAMGPAGFFEKPYSADLLFQAVDNALNH